MKVKIVAILIFVVNVCVAASNENLHAALGWLAAIVMTLETDK